MIIESNETEFQVVNDEPEQEGEKSHRVEERGAALVITLLVMIILLGFVALALSRSTSENIVASNDVSEAQTFEAAQAGLEDTTRDFATVLQSKLNASDSDVTDIKAAPVTGFSDKYTFSKDLKQVGTSSLVTLSSGDFKGLYSLRDEWEAQVTAKQINSEVEVKLRRRFYNNRIPLFQFGAFYNDDLELNRPPLFTFGGKVHTNSNFFVTGFNPNAGIYFKSKVTVVGEVVNDIWKTGTSLNATSDGSGKVYFPNGAGEYKELTTGSGSVKCTTGTGNTILKESNDRYKRNFPYPNCQKNADWENFSKRFEGNLTANASELRLPVDRLKNADGTYIDLIEMMRRGKNVAQSGGYGDKISNGNLSPVAVTDSTQDNVILSKERYANKPGIRISLADSKDELPQCANAGSNPCGVQLDKSISGGGLGYQPTPMLDGYKTTALNANRLAINQSGRGVWIKIELVDYDNAASAPVTKDITEDILSLGVTEPFYSDPGTGANPADSPRMIVANYDKLFSGTRYTGQDSRSVVKFQRFYMDGQSFPSTSGYTTTKAISTTSGTVNYNLVARNSITIPSSGSARTNCLNSLGTNGTSNCTVAAKNSFAIPVGDTVAANSSENSHYRIATFPSDSANAMQIVPFPIQMYDSREGNRADSGSGVTSGEIYRNGVMSMIDIDIYNLRRFFNGDFNNSLPTTTPYAVSKGNVSLKNTDVPENHGWVVYFSDRRGDNDFDGRYTMEDVNPSGALVDEDLNNNKVIDIGGIATSEAPSINQTINYSLAAVTDHRYYRRGVRLINAVEIPGNYNSATPENTQGFTFASENGIYVDGNYNVKIDGVTLSGTSAPAESTSYQPQDTPLHIPSSIVGDSVTVLSNAWNDSNSFVNAFTTTNRVAQSTQVRFAMISGDSLTARTGSTNGNFDGLNGGIHNFMRFLESWNGKRLNYTGSLINLYNSFNNNGRWKCCTTVYDPPTRDWTFDQSFNDPNRLPPGSPYVYYLALTGFERMNN